MKTNSLEFRQMQCQRILKTKPWLKSTGPKTLDGKRKSSMNSRSFNYQFNQLVKQFNKIMKRQKKLQDLIQK